MFSARDPAVHKSIKTPVASLFAMSNMRNYEPYVDECTQLFMDAMRDLKGQKVDLAVWLQWYAFDVVAGLTFQRRFGFLEQRTDVNDMIGQLDAGLDSIRVLGQYPVLDGPAKWLLKQVLPLMGRYDPGIKFVQVSSRNDCFCCTARFSGYLFLTILRCAKTRSPATTSRRRPGSVQISCRSSGKGRRSWLRPIHRAMSETRSSTT
jgi:hypothetical protein